MIARDPNADTEQAVKSWKQCMGYFVKKAKDEGVPVWLETASDKSKKEYEELGFRIAEEVVIGKGRVSGKGWPQEGGEGVRTWAMICDQHLN